MALNHPDAAEAPLPPPHFYSPFKIQEVDTMRRLAAIAVTLLGLGASSASAQDWQPIREQLGKEGLVESGIGWIDFARSDLDVHIGDGRRLARTGALTTWYGFWPTPQGGMILMGDTVVTQDELPGVLEEVRSQGLAVTAIHNHLAGEQPKVLYVHISGQGKGAELASKIKAVLARTNAPTGEREAEEESPSVDWSGVVAILGEPAETEGDLVEYAFPRAEQLRMDGQPMPSTAALETAPEVKIQMLGDGRAVTYGEMILTTKSIPCSGR
jgi:hypothetical protein